MPDRSRLGGNSSSEVKMHVVGANQHTGRPGWREGGIIEELRLDDAANNRQRSWEMWDLLLYDKLVSEPNITLLLDTALFAAEVKGIVRVTYSSIQSNAYQGASELIMGDHGTLFLTQQKGLFYRELGVENPGWSKDGRVDRDASIITSGKTLKMSNDPWAHRGKPLEIDITGDDTREELNAFLDCVQREDPATICNVHNGLIDAATVLIGNQAMKEQQAVDFPNI